MAGRFGSFGASMSGKLSNGFFDRGFAGCTIEPARRQVHRPLNIPGDVIRHRGSGEKGVELADRKTEARRLRAQAVRAFKPEHAEQADQSLVAGSAVCGARNGAEHGCGRHAGQGGLRTLPGRSARRGEGNAHKRQTGGFAGARPCLPGRPSPDQCPRDRPTGSCGGSGSTFPGSGPPAVPDRARVGPQDRGGVLTATRPASPVSRGSALSQPEGTAMDLYTCVVAAAKKVAWRHDHPDAAGAPDCRCPGPSRTPHACFTLRPGQRHVNAAAERSWDGYCTGRLRLLGLYRDP
ncbi:hypothetical protein ABIE56_000363 [Luteibacter sp. 621]